MINFKTISILFIILVLICTISLIFLHETFIYLYVLSLLYIGILTYGVFNISSGYFIKTICDLKTNEKIIALTFDDGPDKNSTEKVLDTLLKYNVEAAFFFIGNSIENNREIVKRTVKEGHLVGNHSFSHRFYFPFLSFRKIQNELQKTNELIFRDTEYSPKYFRPPFGILNPVIVKTTKTLSLKIVGWTIRSLDTTMDWRTSLKRIKRKLKPGAIILLHDRLPNTHSLLEELCEYLLVNNYRIVRFDKIINSQ